MSHSSFVHKSMLFIIFFLDLQWYSSYISAKKYAVFDGCYLCMKDDPFIHLCQPDPGKSCGACCGIYNYTDNSRESLVRRLKQRTEYFRKTVSKKEDVSRFSHMVRMSEDQTRRYEVIYSCEYLGFIDGEGKKIGCLLHPLQNRGLDLRDFSFYGKELCHGHFCPSYHYISREEIRSLIAIIDDWYLYGLCVTDIDLIKEYFRMIADGIAEMPSSEKFKNSILKEIALHFFSFKVSWPFRSPSVNRFGKYYFDGSQHMTNLIDYGAIGCEKSRFDKIFLSLCSEFNHIEELRNGESMIQGNIDEFVRAYHGS